MIWLTAWLKTGLLAVIFGRNEASFCIFFRNLFSVRILEALITAHCLLITN